MDRSEPIASRVAVRLRLPIATVIAACIAISAGNLTTTLVPDAVARSAVFAVVAATAVFFVIAVFDRRFQNAVSAFNSEWRRTSRYLGWKARLFGFPYADRLLLGLTVILFGEWFFLASPGPGSELIIATIFLALLTQGALAVRGQPTDRYLPPS